MFGAGIGFCTGARRRFPGCEPSHGGIPPLQRAPAGARTNFAWALHTGFAYQFSDTMKMDVGYRYLNMGKGETGGPARDQNGGRHGHRHPGCSTTCTRTDIRVGLRWNARCAAGPAGSLG